MDNHIFLANESIEVIEMNSEVYCFTEKRLKPPPAILESILAKASNPASQHEEKAETSNNQEFLSTVVNGVENEACCSIDREGPALIKEVPSETITSVSTTSSSKHEEGTITTRGDVKGSNTKVLYRCLSCNVFFKVLQGVEDHISKVHKTTENSFQVSKSKQHTCLTCNIVFKKLSEIKDHVATVHKTFYKCSYCNNQFRTANKVKEHFKMMNESFLPHKCLTCHVLLHSHEEIKEHCSTTHDNSIATMENIVPAISVLQSKSLQGLDSNNINPTSIPHLELAKTNLEEISEKSIITKPYLAHIVKKDAKNLYCRYCKYYFPNELSFRHHVKSHKNSTQPPLKTKLSYGIDLKVEAPMLIRTYTTTSDKNDAPEIIVTIDMDRENAAVTPLLKNIQKSTTSNNETPTELTVSLDLSKRSGNSDCVVDFPILKKSTSEDKISLHDKAISSAVETSNNSLSTPKSSDSSHDKSVETPQILNTFSLNTQETTEQLKICAICEICSAIFEEESQFYQHYQSEHTEPEVQVTEKAMNDRITEQQSNIIIKREKTDSESNDENLSHDVIFKNDISDETTLTVRDLELINKLDAALNGTIISEKGIKEEIHEDNEQCCTVVEDLSTTDDVNAIDEQENLDVGDYSFTTKMFTIVTNNIHEKCKDFKCQNSVEKKGSLFYFCPYCLKVVNSKMLLKIHLGYDSNLHYESDLFKLYQIKINTSDIICIFCKRKFKNVERYSEHVVACNTSPFVKCKQCDKICNYICELNRHQIRDKHTASGLSCQFCDVAFSNIYSYLEHKSCCAKLSKSFEALCQPIKTHEKVETFYCQFCMSSFDSEILWRFHVKNYHNNGILMFKSPECYNDPPFKVTLSEGFYENTKSVTSKATSNQNVTKDKNTRGVAEKRKANSGIESPSVKRPAVIIKSVMSEQLINAVKKQVNESPEIDFIPCLFCSVKCTSKLVLVNHYLVAHKLIRSLGNQYHQCFVCLKYFENVDSFKCHILQYHFKIYSHSKEYLTTLVESLKGSEENFIYLPDNVDPLTCIVCNLTCSSRYFLNEHLMQKHKRNETNTSTLLCIYCNCDFTKKRDLNYHITSVHKACKLCNIFFEDVEQLNAHIKLHNLGQIVFYGCQICNIMYSIYSNFIGHMRKKHDYKGDERECKYNRVIRRFVNDEPSIRCVYCDISYENRHNLNSHINMFHYVMKCLYCGNHYVPPNAFAKSFVPKSAVLYCQVCKNMYKNVQK